MLRIATEKVGEKNWKRHDRIIGMDELPATISTHVLKTVSTMLFGQYITRPRGVFWRHFVVKEFRVNYLRRHRDFASTFFGELWEYTMTLILARKLFSRNVARISCAEPGK